MSRDSLDCFLGCLEGPSIFLESFIHLRVLSFVCGEGAAVGHGLACPPSPEDQSEESGQFSGVVFNSKQVFYS